MLNQDVRLEEERWLRAYKNYRGVYDSSTQYRSNERSQVFIKITKTKVLAAYGQIVDILFANTKFPISVDSTPMPTGIDEFAHLSKVPVEEALKTILVLKVMVENFYRELRKLHLKPLLTCRTKWS